MDTQTRKLITGEAKRQQETLNLIASENIVSCDVREALGSVFTHKYAEGYPGKRYYGGQRYTDELELLVQERARTLFGLSSKTWQVNVQPYSGSPANLAIYSALIPFGAKIMGMELAMGGHLTHGHAVSITGKLWKQVPYGVDKKTEKLDYKNIRAIAKKEKPQALVVGYTAYPRKISFNICKDIADEVGAYLIADISHIAGLVAARVHPSPFRYADVVMATTHKTLRGPRGAMIYSRTEHADKINKAVFPGLQGGPHMNQIAALSVALYEAQQTSFRTYTKQVVVNTQMLAAELHTLGWRVVSGGTDTHLLLVDVTDRDLNGSKASAILERVGIVVNKNTIPYDTRSPFNPSGIRIGTPTVTTRGMKVREMKYIARLIHEALTEARPRKDIAKDVKKLCRSFPIT